MPLPLLDNQPIHKCEYEVHVYTGSKKHSETDSHVYLHLQGELDDSGERWLEDGQRKVGMFTWICLL